MESVIEQQMGNSRSNAAANTNAFLQARDVSENYILNIVKRYYPLTSEAVIICGSVAEGNANKQSDFDMLLIGEEAFTSGNVVKISESSELLIHHEDIERLGVLQIERIDPTCLNEWLNRIAAIRELIEHLGQKTTMVKKLKFQMLTTEEQRSLHRLFSGHVIHGQNIISALKEKNIDRLQYATIFTSFNNYISARNDVIGHIEENDIFQAAHTLRKLAILSVALSLSVLGETKVSERWAPRDIQKYSQILGHSYATHILNALYCTPDSDLKDLLSGLDEVTNHLSVLIDKERPAASGLVRVLRNYSHSQGHKQD